MANVKGKVAGNMHGQVVAAVSDAISDEGIYGALEDTVSGVVYRVVTGAVNNEWTHNAIRGELHGQ